MQQVRVAYSQLVVVEELLSPSKMATFGSCAAGVVWIAQHKNLVYHSLNCIFKNI